EAARAGEAGKGFAVVASEVKALAGQTTRATEEISSQINAIQSASRLVVESISTIGSTIGKVNEISGAIAAAVEQQSAATREIARNIDQASVGTRDLNAHMTVIAEVVSESGTAAGQMLEASSELAQRGETLRVGVDRFLTEVAKVV
ncbi:MAG: methyl-accepting chemotaxis protein, partial [Rhodobiaceae bacterium]|nr:methyl-accepting chemotaxis protein [Rhodobiaceae bacterium]